MFFKRRKAKVTKYSKLLEMVKSVYDILKK